MYIDASHNILFKLADQPAKWQEDFRKSNESEICGYQEVGGAAARKALIRNCVDNHRSLFMPNETSNPISWLGTVFDTQPIMSGVKVVHPSAKAMGVNTKAGSERDFSYIGLRHLKTGRKILRINVHSVARATDPTPEESKALAEWSDWAIGQYWLDVVAFVANQMSRPDPENPRKSFWDAITLGGDYNGDLVLQSSDEWYYPSRLLPGLFVMDQINTGLDHLQHARGSDVFVVHRWAKNGHTDHRIHFVERGFRNVPDFPA